MSIREAIQKAIIEGGFTGHPLSSWHEHDKYQIFLDPLFWQSLGKAMGWEYVGPYQKTPWETEWHCFLDFLAEGKTAEEFFAELPVIRSCGLCLQCRREQ